MGRTSATNLPRMSHRTKHAQASGEWRPAQTPSRLSVQFTGRRLIAGAYSEILKVCLIFTIQNFFWKIFLLGFKVSIYGLTLHFPVERTVWGTWKLFNRSDIQFASVSLPMLLPQILPSPTSTEFFSMPIQEFDLVASEQTRLCGSPWMDPTDES